VSILLLAQRFRFSMQKYIGIFLDVFGEFWNTTRAFYLEKGERHGAYFPQLLTARSVLHIDVRLTSIRTPRQIRPHF
jgi:hypothetical protein